MYQIGCPSVYQSVYLLVFLCVFPLSLSVLPMVRLASHYSSHLQSVFTTFFLSVSPFILLSVRLAAHLLFSFSLCFPLSTCQSVSPTFLSVCLSIYLVIFPAPISPHVCRWVHSSPKTISLP